MHRLYIPSRRFAPDSDPHRRKARLLLHSHCSVLSQLAHPRTLPSSRLPWLSTPCHLVSTARGIFLPYPPPRASTTTLSRFPQRGTATTHTLRVQTTGTADRRSPRTAPCGERRAPSTSVTSSKTALPQRRTRSRYCSLRACRATPYMHNHMSSRTLLRCK